MKLRMRLKRKKCGYSCYYFGAALVIWTIFMAAIATALVHVEHEDADAGAIASARRVVDIDMMYRRWASEHGGVYVPVTKETQPDPFLEDAPERDAITSTGTRLTLINPAHMMRRVFSKNASSNHEQRRIVSLHPINPENAPDSWETDALHQMSHGATEVVSKQNVDGKDYVRYLRRIEDETSCHQCHDWKNHEPDDVIGAIGAVLPAQPIEDAESADTTGHALLIGCIWALGALYLIVGGRYVRRWMAKIERARVALEASANRQKAYADLGRTAVSAKDGDEYMHNVVQLAGSALEAECCVVWKIDSNENECGLWARHGRDLGGDNCVMTPEFAATLVRFSATSQGAVIVDDVAHESRFSLPEHISDCGIGSFISVVIGDTQEPIGMLVACFRSTRSLTCDERDFLEVAAADVADVIGRMRLEQDHLRLAEAVRNSDRRFLEVLHASADAILLIDGDRFVECNDAAAHMLGLSDRAEVLNTHPAELSPPTQPDGQDSAQKAKAMIDVACARGSSRFEWLHHKADGTVFPVEVTLIAIQHDGKPILHCQWRDLSKTKRIEKQLRSLSAAVEQSPVSVVITDTLGTIQYVNPKFTEVTGYTAEEALGQNPRILKSGNMDDRTYRELWDSITSGKPWRGEFHNKTKTGDLFWESATIAPIFDETGNVRQFVGIKEDITEKKRREHELAQAQKLEAIGQLASGIAHEINTPIQFVGDNLRFLDDSTKDLMDLTDKLTDLMRSEDEQLSWEDRLSRIQHALEDADYAFLKEELPTAIQQSLEGVDRVATIVRSMKEFAHPGGSGTQLADLKRAIESTITVARNEWKYVADVETDFDPGLPLVPCRVSEFNQVILNLIINAAHAIGDVIDKNAAEKGTIFVSAIKDGDCAEIRVRDTGCGIPEEIRNRIFEPFFTTKGVGKGSGQGLAIAHATIVKNHGGTLTVESEVGAGTTFIIRLPIHENLTESEGIPNCEPTFVMS